MLLFLLIISVAPLYSFQEWDLRIEPEIYAVKIGLKRSLENHEFIEAALYFSGVQRDRIPSYLDRYMSIIRQFKSYAAEKGVLEGSEREKGELLLEFLHSRVFNKYEEYITDLDRLFDEGLYNCVSSGILYYAAAEATGLEVEGVLTSDHAFCRVITAGGEIDVETTTVYGFDPGVKKEFADSFGKTGFVYTPPGNYMKRTKIGKKDFLALILQNRIAQLQKKGNFKDTVAPAVDRCFILNSTESYRDMLNEFKNYCVVLNNRKKYSDALYFLECIYSEYGFSEIISDTAVTLYQNMVIDNLSSDDTVSAKALYDKYVSFPLLPGNIKKDVFYEINEKELYIEIQNGNFSNSLSLLEEKRAKREIPDKIYYEYYVYIYSSEIERTANSEGWVASLDLVNRALEKSDDERLLQLEKAVIYNIGVIYHNRFADYFNNQDYEEARITVEEGLEIVPDDRKLLNDLKTLNNLK